MARFGRRRGVATTWRPTGRLDETRHGQLQTYFPYQALAKEPRLDWAHKAYHTNEWGIIALRGTSSTTCSPPTTPCRWRSS